MEYLLLLLVIFPIFGGLINFFISKKFNKAREIIAIAISIIELVMMVVVLIVNPLSLNVIGLSFKADGFRAIYGLIATFMWMCTVLFSKEYMKHYENKDRYYLFYLLTLGATVGVFVSNDLWTTFMFFEMMSLTSFVLVIHDEKKETIKAALTYLVVAIISGMILLMGMFLLNGEVHTLNFDEIFIACQNGISTKTFIAGILMLIGFGAKAGMFPLHIWLPKAHPVAPAPASALLSGILTKSGVFGIIVIVVNIFNSNKTFAIILLVLAMITMLLGAILAVFSINFKRTLACSSMSQIGFILTGLAMMIFLNVHNGIAYQGSFLHMVNHSLIKLSLFMIAGVIYMNIHKLNLNEIRGYGRKKHLLKVCFALAALGIMGIPMFNGYISKTLIHESMVEYIHMISGLEATLFKIAEYAFLFAGGLTIAYMIKLFVCVFVEKNEDEKVQEQYDNNKKYMGLLSTIVIVVSSFILPFLGFIPTLTSDKLSSIAYEFFKVDSHLHFADYFIWANLKGAVISLVIGLAVYFGLIRTLFMKKNENGNKQYVDLWPSVLDLETLVYRPVIFAYKKKGVLNVFSYIVIFIVRAISEFLDGIIYFVRRFILNQYKYEFDGSPLTFKIGRWIDKKRNQGKPVMSYRLLEKRLLLKDINDTLNATFSFDFLMACIGVVTILLIMLIK